MDKVGQQTLPQAISRFWLKRLCEISLLASLIVLALFTWARFIPTGHNFSIGIVIDDIAAGTAAIASVASLIIYFWLPKSHSYLTALVVYSLLSAMVVSVILTSGGVASPFVGIWPALAIFANFFGNYVMLLMALVAISSVGLYHFQTGLDLPLLIIHLIFSLLPLVFSAMLWQKKSEKKRKNSFSELADKLSFAEGKSDIVINTIDDGVVAINKSGAIDLLNPAAQTLTGWDSKEALELDWRSVLKIVNVEGRELTELDNPIAQAIENNHSVHSEKYFLQTPSGKKRLVSIVASPISQNRDGVIVVIRDITKEKAEEREQAEFISTASHEMRTPVASIEGYLGLALNPATATIDEKARDFITKAHESARHLGELFQNLLDITKSEDGRLKNEPQVIDVTATTNDIFEGFAHLAAEKQLRYFFKPSPSLDNDGSERRLQPVFYAHVDPNHFREVISNLITNAIKYTPKGDVLVDITGDDKSITISVEDSGVGIPAEDIPHLFQKFYRVDNSDTREIGGTGLGLFLCRKLAETMGGHLRVESTHGQGSTFFLDIPRLGHEEAMDKLNKLAEEPVPIIKQDRPALEDAELNDSHGVDIFDIANPTTQSQQTIAPVDAPPTQEPPLMAPQQQTPAPVATQMQPHQVAENPHPSSASQHHQIAPIASEPQTSPLPQALTTKTLADIEASVARGEQAGLHSQNQTTQVLPTHPPTSDTQHQRSDFTVPPRNNV